MRIAAVIAAGGTGTRIGASEPKQFLDLAGKPILLRTVEGILRLPEVEQVIIALPLEHLERARELLAGCAWRVPITCVAGGLRRQDSVARGVSAVDPAIDLILVHDAVRPLCDEETMKRVAGAARAQGCAVPGLLPIDTIQRVSRRGKILSSPAREELRTIQTPQGFRAGILRDALHKAEKEGYLGTDESSVVRWAGHSVVVVPGSHDNIKITLPRDLETAALLLERRDRRGPRSMRIGQGMDYHRLVPGRPLVLGGVEIPFESGLEGHSDADALVHAVCDAVLGAAGLGDIGRHYPDSDPANRNRPSLEFLREISAKAAGLGWSLSCVDATVLAERPRLSPFMDAMRVRIAEALGVTADRVNVKATSTEGMNAEGRGEGISAHAVVLLERPDAAAAPGTG